MSTREFTYNDIFDSGSVFFEKKGSSVMVLTPKAAIEVCQEAAKRNLWILGIDGGHWLNPGFRPDGSTSWTYNKPNDYKPKLTENNKLAIDNIKEDAANGYTAFLVTISKPY
ncbi:colicin transporter (plasmid) [Morganella morganii]|uniref:colicin transporter n=1 Tax=Morganella morganii TaxID=582 RepID=UPI00386B1FA1